MNYHNRKRPKHKAQVYDSFMIEGLCFGLMSDTEYITCGLLAGTVIGMCIQTSDNGNENKTKNPSKYTDMTIWKHESINA